MAAQPHFRFATVEEYLASDRAAQVKSEFYDGEVLAMSGGSLNHATLIARLTSLIDRALAGGPCRAISGDLRVRAGLATNYVYPDFTVVCGEPELDGDDILLNPIAVFEVLSPTTEAIDRGRKFTAYRETSSIHLVVFVAQDRPLVEVHRRAEGGAWMLTEGRAGQVLNLQEIGASLNLGELYSSIEFARRPGDQPP